MSRFACPDWRERLAQGRTLMPALDLDPVLAARAVNIYNRLRLHDVIGMPTFGEAGADWFREIVAAIFGSLDPATRMRAVSDVFLEVPKKNSKTTNGAGLMITALLMNQRPSASFALFGPRQAVSQLAYDAAAGMIEADKDGLKDLFHTQDHLKKITHRRSGAELKVMTFDPGVATGGKFAGWLLDELHELGTAHYAERVIGQLRGARAAIPESFGVIITTQSNRPPAGIFKKELAYAREVRDGKIADPQVLPILYEFPEEMQKDPDRPWEKPENWHIVNPNMGRSVSLPVLKTLFQADFDKGLESQQIWASQHLNIEIGLALHNDRWPGADHWQAAADPAGFGLDELLERCEVVTIGVDGGGLDDLLGVCVLGREKETRRWLAWFKGFADSSVLTLRKSIAPSLEQFVTDGDLELGEIGAVEGINPDVEAVAEIAERVWNSGLLPEKYGIGLDAVGVAAITDEIAARGIPPECMTAVRQGFHLNGVIRGAPRKLKDGTLRHAGQPIAAWCVGNAKMEASGSAVVITKQAAGTAKIDLLIALFNAFYLMSRNPAPANGPLADDYFTSLKEQAA